MPGRPRLLAIDIDGTLLDSFGRLPDDHRVAVTQAVNENIAVVLATGRALHFARPVASALTVPVALMVNNGAVIRSADGLAAIASPLSRDVAQAILADTAAFEESVALVFDRDDDRQIVFEAMDWNHPQRQGYYRVNRKFLSKMPLREALADDPLQVMFNGAIEPMRQLFATLRNSALAGQFTVAITEYEARDFALVDVNAPGCSKGATLARWAALHGIPREHVMAVGDNLNDLDMLEFAGTAVVMGNAVDAIKQRGFPVAPTHDDHGLAVAIRQFALGRGT